jgi:anaerobic ribonucleoside-triphosphate reductase activating protein
MVKYYNYDIVFREIPEEVSLALNITNCQNRCSGCHSPHLRENIGTKITPDVLDDIITKNKGITCFLFMGEGDDSTALLSVSSYIKDIYGLKIALYSGRDIVEDFYYDFWDYLKIGHYNKIKGGLDSKITNQKLFHSKNDITERFWKL